MMVVIIKASFLTMKFKGKELMFGIKIKNILVNGKTTKCMVKEKLYGKKVDKFIKDNIKTIRSMV